MTDVPTNVVSLTEWTESRRLDGRRGSSTRPRMATGTAEATTIDWKRVGAQLTAFVFRNTRKRDWHLAKEIAQQAITEYFAHPERWNPQKKSLVRHLGHEGLRIARNEMRRRRMSFEVAMDYVDLVEHEVDDGEELASDILEQKRYAKEFYARLIARLAGDEPALVVVALMMEDIATPLAQQKASGLSLEVLRDARRRVFYKAEQIAKELSDEIDAESEGKTDEEVAP